MKYIFLAAVALSFAVRLADSAAAEPLDEAAAAEKIELLGGRITRDEALPDHPMIGVDFSERRKIRNQFLGLLGSLSHLTTLDLSETNITDGGLAEIEGLTALTTLVLDGSRISDEGLRAVGKLTNLRMLSLHGTEITDAGLQSLPRAIEPDR